MKSKKEMQLDFRNSVGKRITVFYKAGLFITIILLVCPIVSRSEILFDLIELSLIISCYLIGRKDGMLRQYIKNRQEKLNLEFLDRKSRNKYFNSTKTGKLYILLLIIFLITWIVLSILPTINPPILTMMQVLVQTISPFIIVGVDGMRDGALQMLEIDFLKKERNND